VYASNVKNGEWKFDAKAISTQIIRHWSKIMIAIYLANSETKYAITNEQVGSMILKVSTDSHREHIKYVFNRAASKLVRAQRGAVPKCGPLTDL